MMQETKIQFMLERMVLSFFGKNLEQATTYVCGLAGVGKGGFWFFGTIRCLSRGKGSGWIFHFLLGNKLGGWENLDFFTNVYSLVIKRDMDRNKIIGLWNPTFLNLTLWNFKLQGIIRGKGKNLTKHYNVHQNVASLGLGSRHGMI